MSAPVPEPGGPTLVPHRLPPALADRVPGRLRIVSFAGAVLLGLLLAVEPLRGIENTLGDRLRVGILAFGLAVCLVVTGLAASARVAPGVLARVALGFQVAMGGMIWVLEFSAPFGVLPHTPGVPTVCVWLVLFPLIVPNAPLPTLASGMLTAALGPLVLGAFVSAGQVAPSPVRAGLWFLAALTAAVVGVWVSRAVNQLEGRVRELRRLGSYHLVERIGAGGMGEVWTARHHLLARTAAIKMIRADRLGGDPAARETALVRFEREAQATAALRSPHTVELYDFGATDDGQLYYVMEHLDGLDLSEVVERFGPMPAARVVHVLEQACASIAEAHARGLLHRDLKPANLFLCRLGTAFDFVKVLDFGTVKVARSQEALDPTVTQEGAAVGTPAFMAPEVLFGEAGTAADVYALGCIAYWLLTGNLVFAADSTFAMVRAHVEEAPVPPGLRGEVDVPPALEAVVMRCLAKDPGERPPVDTLVASLREVRATLPPWGPPEAEAWWRGHLPDLARSTSEVVPL